MKICKNYREFKKILRKYGKSLEFQVCTPKQAREVLRSSKSDSTLKSMVELFVANKNQMVRCDYKCGILRGVCISNFSYSYMVEIEDEIHYVNGNLVAV